MIRLATKNDIAAVGVTYDQLLKHEQINGGFSNWILGVYPTIKIAEEAVKNGTMYVLDNDGEICASMIMNNVQADEYGYIDWLYPAEKEKVLVVHTLCIPPKSSRKGYGKQMVEFAKDFAKKSGCDVIRIDTYAHNEPAKSLYQKCGFRIAGYHEALLHGLILEELAFLEYKL